MSVRPYCVFIVWRRVARHLVKFWQSWFAWKDQESFRVMWVARENAEYDQRLSWHSVVKIPCHVSGQCFGISAWNWVWSSDCDLHLDHNPCQNGSQEPRISGRFLNFINFDSSHENDHFMLSHSGSLVDGCEL
jgi:hypothetical protein